MLIALNGFSRKPVGLFTGLFTPVPPRVDTVMQINRLMPT